MAYLPLYLAARGLSGGEIAFLVALPYIALCGASLLLWGVFVATLGSLPGWALYLLFLAMGMLGMGNGAVFQLVPQRFPNAAKPQPRRT